MTETFTLPYEKAYQGSSQWNTLVDEVFSGSEQRRDCWTESRKSWILEFKKNPENFHTLLNFFDARKGKKEAFYWTWAKDYSNGFNVATDIKAVLTSPSNLVALWLFDTVSGTTVLDYSGNYRNLTLSADASTLTPAKTAEMTYLDFNGTPTFSAADADAFSFNSLGEELITNGSFTTDTIGWSSSNATLESVGSGQSDNCLKITNTAANYGYAYQSFTTVIGQTYRLSFYEQNGTFSAYFRVGTTPNGTQNYPNSGASFGTWGNKTVEFTATATTTYVTFAVNTPVIGSYIYIDEVSIKAVLDNPFSLFAYINPNSVSSSTILGKNTSYNREWYLSFNSTNRFIAVYYDESTGGNIQTYTDSRVADVGSWHSYCMAYSGSSAPSGIDLYCDGSLLTSADAANSGAGGAYAAMESLGASVSNTINGGTKGNSKYGMAAIFSEKLSIAQQTAINAIITARSTSYLTNKHTGGNGQQYLVRFDTDKLDYNSGILGYKSLSVPIIEVKS